MGIVDYAASTCLAASGLALAAPFIESKVPAVAGLTRALAQYRKYIGIFGIIGGALGLLLIPLLLIVFVGFADLASNFLVPIVAFFELIGCAATIGLGVLVLRSAPHSETAPSGELDVPTLAGFGGIAYGGFLMFLFTVVQALA